MGLRRFRGSWSQEASPACTFPESSPGGAVLSGPRIHAPSLQPTRERPSAGDLGHTGDQTWRRAFGDSSGWAFAGSGADSEERPSAGDAFEFVFAAVLERVFGGAEEVGDGP